MSGRSWHPAVRRYLVAWIGLLVVLEVTMLAGAARERSALPRATGQLRSAIAAASGLLACFEGVQDDLVYGVDVSDGARAVAVANALTRLEGCDVEVVADRVAQIDLPPAPPVIDPDRRRVREALQDGIGNLDRAILDGRRTRQAMRDDLADGIADDPDVVVGFRVVQASYEAAFRTLATAEGVLAGIDDPDRRG